MNCLAAISGGPDSMALLAWMEEQQLDYGICHVNYHKRPSAARDEAIVRQWARAHHRPLLVLHPDYPGGNFQGWARQARYGFFAAVARSAGVETVYLGHHLDDSIETWMLQKARGTLCDHYGLAPRTPWQNLWLIRPLLGYEKKELQAWCDHRGIPYGIDESNQSDDYARNRLRHAKIERADRMQKERWLLEMARDQQALEQLRARAARLAGQPASLWLQDKLNWLALDRLLFEKTGRHASKKALIDACEKLRGGHVATIDGQRLQASGGRLVFAPPVPVDFWIGSMEQLRNLCENEIGYASFRLSGRGKKIESFNVKKDDFPLIIRPARAGDSIEMRYGTRKIARLHIDRRIPRVLRGEYPLIEGRNGVVFAALAGCAPAWYIEKASFFMLEWSV